MTDADLELIHLIGYGAIAGVLGTAEWAGSLGLIIALPILGWAAYEGALAAIGRLEARARRDIEPPADAGGEAVATDGGSRRREEILAGIEEHGSGAIRDEVLVDELQEGER